MLNVKSETSKSNHEKTDVAELILSIRTRYDEIVSQLKLLHAEKSRLETFFPVLKDEKKERRKDVKDEDNNQTEKQA